MYSKASLALVSALAAIAQAANNYHGHDHLHHKRESFPTLSGSGLLPGGLAPFGTASSGAPFPTGTGSAAPLSTGVVPPLSTGASGSGSSPSSVGESGDTTLTYTIGTGSSTTVITTTIHHTIYQTATSVSFITFDYRYELSLP